MPRLRVLNAGGLRDGGRAGEKLYCMRNWHPDFTIYYRCLRLIVGLAAKGGSGHGWAGTEILIPFAQGRSAGFEVDQIAKGDPVKAGGKGDMADGDRVSGIKMCFEIVEGFDQFGFLSVGQGRIA